MDKSICVDQTDDQFQANLSADLRLLWGRLAVAYQFVPPPQVPWQAYPQAIPQAMGYARVRYLPQSDFLALLGSILNNASQLNARTAINTKAVVLNGGIQRVIASMGNGKCISF
jgi:hypothetical protein